MRVRNVQPAYHEGIRFDSKRERNRWLELKLMEKQGEISELQRQVKIPLFGQFGAPILTAKGRQRYYIADFTYLDGGGRLVIEDAKGFPTEIYKLKRDILRAMGIEIREV